MNLKLQKYKIDLSADVKNHNASANTAFVSKMVKNVIPNVIALTVRTNQSKIRG